MDDKRCKARKTGQTRGVLAINSGRAHIDPVSDGGMKSPSGAAETGRKPQDPGHNASFQAELALKQVGQHNLLRGETSIHDDQTIQLQL
jgi:hypothetical protein